MSDILPPTVSLDGSAVRRIREEKKLTQLYVAKVVGVTTDTISRWENNRYPSIKRENGLRLAEALEVDLGEILQPEAEAGEPEASADSVEPRVPLAIKILPLFGLVVVLAALSYYYHRQDLPVAGLLAERVLPHYAAPGGVVPVRVRLAPNPGIKGFILREHFPQGWKLIEASPPASSLNNEDGTARWIVKPGERRPLIVYLVRVAKTAQLGDSGLFRGEVVANPNGANTPTPVMGDNQVQVGPYLWADQNGDHRVDDSEMLAASDTFDEMKGVHLDWNQLEAIWDAEGYRWDPRKEVFVPQHPPSEKPASN